MSKSDSGIAKSVLISAGIALITGFGFYMFFRIHQELGVAPVYGWGLGVLAFIASVIATMAYFNTRARH